MSGTWVFVCGPSGGGKDSVIDWAARALAARAGVVFARRMVTRPMQTGSDHESVSRDDFDFLRHSDALAWHWQAHGYAYGVPMRYAHQVAWGRVVVVNGSREHVAGIRCDARVRCAVVMAPPAQLAARLRQRGRDAPAAIDQRLERNALLGGVPTDLVIDNSGALADAGEALANYLEFLAGAVVPPPRGIANV